MLPLQRVLVPRLATSFLPTRRLLSHTPAMADYPDKRTEEQWRSVLDPLQFRCLRQGGTEPPFSHPDSRPSRTKPFLDTSAPGLYRCTGCGAPLYRAATKFASGCGWPAYYDSIPGAVERRTDASLGMVRTEIRCARCGGHLGHVFTGEGYGTPTDERHCVNGVCLRYSAE